MIIFTKKDYLSNDFRNDMVRTQTDYFYDPDNNWVMLAEHPLLPIYYLKRPQEMYDIDSTLHNLMSSSNSTNYGVVYKMYQHSYPFYKGYHGFLRINEDDKIPLLPSPLTDLERPFIFMNYNKLIDSINTNIKLYDKNHIYARGEGLNITFNSFPFIANNIK